MLYALRKFQQTAGSVNPKPRDYQLVSEMTSYPVGIEFVKGVPSLGQRPFWIINFLAIDKLSGEVVRLDDVEALATWLVARDGTIEPLADRNRPEWDELPNGWRTLLERYIEAKTAIRAIVERMQR